MGMASDRSFIHLSGFPGCCRKPLRFPSSVLVRGNSKLVAKIGYKLRRIGAAVFADDVRPGSSLAGLKRQDPSFHSPAETAAKN
jgi:hypothetical protein